VCVPVVIDHWRTISAIWNNGALRGACGSRHSILKQCAAEFFPTMEQGKKEKSSERIQSGAFFWRGEGVGL